LYCSGVLSLVFAVVFLASVAGMQSYYQQTQSFGGPSSAGWRSLLPRLLLGDVPPFVVLAVPYALWWAKGVARNPYLRRRGFGVYLAHAVGYCSAWVILARFLFDPGELRGLL
jgi:hypothetical protein